MTTPAELRPGGLPDAVRDRPRLAQVANYVGPASGGLRVVVAALGEAHVRDGGHRLAVVPGPADDDVCLRDTDRRLVVRSPGLPGAAGHHVLLARAVVREHLAAFRPDVLEIHDQTTLAWLPAWARRRGIPTVLFAHEHLPLVVSEITGLPPRWTERVGHRWQARLSRDADAVVCASDFAARGYERAGARNVHRIPFGVDLELFTPHARSTVSAPWSPGALRLVQVARLHPEKAPGLALDALGWLRAAGVRAELVMAGTGPLEAAIRRRIARERLPVRLMGHVTDRGRLAGLLAAADVALALGPRETFGLSVLEAMAAGTPVVVHEQGASRELLAPGTGLTAATAAGAAAAVRRLAADPLAGARARRRAEQFPWTATCAAIGDLERALTATGAASEG